MKIRWKTFIIAVLIPLLTGGLSALISKNGFKDFQNMNQPPLSPPAWLFPVAWTVLYIFMGIASYLVFSSQSSIDDKKNALIFYGAQLFFNFLWSPIFFVTKQYLFAFVWLFVMWVLIIITTLKFLKSEKRAGALMIPYLLWVTFAGYLNFGVFLLN